ncbi:MAG: 3-phosphoshikimate 1-carboxyvinyltransferase [Candidatus Thalassarchaeum sp.]
MEPMDLEGVLDWALPPSKSHMIRWLVLAAQSSGTLAIRFSQEPGLDISSMAECLKTLGAVIERKEGEWIISGVGEGGFGSTNRVLDCGNSGTTARFLMAIAAGLSEPVTIDGDDSLRGRSMSVIAGVLRDLGCSVSGDMLPLTVTGPLKTGTARIDLSSSGQPLSAMLLATPGFTIPVTLDIVGRSVSRGYQEMSFDIAESCGSQNLLSEEEIELRPWKVNVPEAVTIPTEDSLMAIAMLISELHGVRMELSGAVESASPAIVSLSEQSAVLDLRDESDLICPASVLMAIGKGGRITGAAHSRGKESDRIDSTVYLLRAFGMDAEATKDGLEIRGSQSPSRPEIPIDSRRDHRLAMTAMALASRYGGVISEPEICAVSDPGFISRLIGLGD